MQGGAKKDKDKGTAITDEEQVPSCVVLSSCGCCTSAVNIGAIPACFACEYSNGVSLAFGFCAATIRTERLT